MKHRLHLHTQLFAILIAVISITACSTTEVSTPCANEQYQAIDALIQTGDGMGHGPDIGSSEWKSVIERKLGLEGNAQLPSPNSDSWCQFIERRIKTK